MGARGWGRWANGNAGSGALGQWERGGGAGRSAGHGPARPRARGAASAGTGGTPARPCGAPCHRAVFQQCQGRVPVHTLSLPVLGATNGSVPSCSGRPRGTPIERPQPRLKTSGVVRGVLRVGAGPNSRRWQQGYFVLVCLRPHSPLIAGAGVGGIVLGAPGSKSQLLQLPCSQSCTTHGTRGLGQSRGQICVLGQGCAQHRLHGGDWSFPRDPGKDHREITSCAGVVSGICCPLLGCGKYPCSQCQASRMPVPWPRSWQSSGTPSPAAGGQARCWKGEGHGCFLYHRQLPAPCLSLRCSRTPSQPHQCHTGRGTDIPNSEPWWWLLMARPGGADSAVGLLLIPLPASPITSPQLWLHPPIQPGLPTAPPNPGSITEHRCHGHGVT